MLELEQDKRISAQVAKQHPFFDEIRPSLPKDI
jgi:hypothetical protein